MLSCMSPKELRELRENLNGDVPFTYDAPSTVDVTVRKLNSNPYARDPALAAHRCAPAGAPRN